MLPSPLLSWPVAKTYHFSPSSPTTSAGSCAARSPDSRHGSSACAGTAGAAATAGGARAARSPSTAAPTVGSGANRTGVSRSARGTGATAATPPARSPRRGQRTRITPLSDGATTRDSLDSDARHTDAPRREVTLVISHHF